MGPGPGYYRGPFLDEGPSSAPPGVFLNDALHGGDTLTATLWYVDILEPNTAAYYDPAPGDGSDLKWCIGGATQDDPQGFDVQVAGTPSPFYTLRATDSPKSGTCTLSVAQDLPTGGMFLVALLQNIQVTKPGDDGVPVLHRGIRAFHPTAASAAGTFTPGGAYPSGFIPAGYRYWLPYLPAAAFCVGYDWRAFASAQCKCRLDIELFPTRSGGQAALPYGSPALGYDYLQWGGMRFVIQDHLHGDQPLVSTSYYYVGDSPGSIFDGSEGGVNYRGSTTSTLETYSFVFGPYMPGLGVNRYNTLRMGEDNGIYPRDTLKGDTLAVTLGPSTAAANVSGLNDAPKAWTNSDGYSVLKVSAEIAPSPGFAAASGLSYTLTYADGTTEAKTYTGSQGYTTGGVPFIHDTLEHVGAHSMGSGEYALAPQNSLSLIWKGSPQTVTVPRFGCGPVTPTHTTPPPPAPKPLSVVRTVIVPVMDVDTVSGRLYLAIGAASYRAEYSQQFAWQVDGNGFPLLFAPPGAALSAPTYSQHQSYPVYLCVARGRNGSCPFVFGDDIGADLLSGKVTLPDSLVILPQEGKVRVGLRRYDPSSVTLDAIAAWRETLDLGLTFTDGPASWLGTEPIGAPPRNHAFLTGSRRGRRVMALTGLQEPVSGREAQGGASGWAYSHGVGIALFRLPLWEVSTAFSGYSSPYTARNPGHVETRPYTSFDSGLTTAPDTAATTGALLPSLKAVPGYPFAGEWAGYAPDAQPIFAYPPDAGSNTLSVAGSPAPVMSPAGGLVWARGYSNATLVYVFAPAIMRLPLARASYVPTDSNALEEGFKQYTDAEGGAQGKNWGHHTPVVYSYTADGGKSFGPLYVLKVAGTVPLFDTATVRVAAACGPGDVIYVCVCAAGSTRLYEGRDPAGDFVQIGGSHDAGQTWYSGAG